MTRIQLKWHEYRYFPYERALAAWEARALTGGEPRETPTGLDVELNACEPDRLRRLTYFREVIMADGSVLVPDQAILEASYGNLTDRHWRRQGTRYAVHGLHEYRGKFNPQVVRAVVNCLGVEPGMWLLDPCCGSGTSLVESHLMGINAVGTDINPLAVLIAEAKLAAMACDLQTLADASERISDEILRRSASQSFETVWSEEHRTGFGGANWRNRIPEFNYLSSWFPLDVLAQMAGILAVIDDHAPSRIGSYFRVILSDLLRDVSLQDPGDLRIRRRKGAACNYPLVPLFVRRTARQTRLLQQAMAIGGQQGGMQHAMLTDNRDGLALAIKACIPTRFPGFDVAVTSPPYATALPYIDTQRLSLILLGLVSRAEIGALERGLTGTRELHTRRLRELGATIERNEGVLPASVVELCTKLRGLLGPTDGFRRKRMPALMYAYFSDIAAMMENVRQVMRPGAAFALLVGRNRTVVGGRDVVIDTPTLMGQVAESRGWRLQSLIEFDTYQRYSMHSRNSITSEVLVVLRNPRANAEIRTGLGPA